MVYDEVAPAALPKVQVRLLGPAENQEGAKAMNWRHVWDGLVGGLLVATLALSLWCVRRCGTLTRDVQALDRRQHAEADAIVEMKEALWPGENNHD